MLRTFVTVISILIGLSTAILQSTRRPFELVLAIHEDSTCSVVSVRQTQRHKVLSDQPGHYVVERHRKLVAGLDEELRVFAFDQEVFRELGFFDCTQAHSLTRNVIAWDESIVPFGFTGISTVSQQSVMSKSPVDDVDGDARVPPLRIERLIESGPPNNRIDLVFFSDGYTSDEYDKFMADATRLAEDVSGNQTFNTVKPLLNFWAAFSPSNESGIGTGGKPKEHVVRTPYGLYRTGTELRGVYYSKPKIAHAACVSMGDRCDYPILMGNDPFYGGLGGPFTVITPSLANGALVLRHELGHSTIEVGEEYDGGFAYCGVNTAYNRPSLPWSHWLSRPVKDAAPHVERSVMPMQEYPWTLLNTTEPWSTSFSSSGQYRRHLVKVSLSGIPNAGDLRVEIDGVDLGWVPRKDIGFDRWHYDIHKEDDLRGGMHEIKFTLINETLEGQAQLCSVEVLEFGDRTQFNATPGHYGVFPTFSDKNETSYRPTNEDCLMRAVTKPNFCKVCMEGLWLSLLKRVDLIDNIHEGCQWHAASDSKGKWMKTLDLQLVPLAEFRGIVVNVQESFSILWTKDGKRLNAFTNKTSITLEDNDAVGKYDVKIKFATEEVRVDSAGMLTAKGVYIVERSCTHA